MRPVERGDKPQGLTIGHYRDAAGALRERLGAFCSYCEKPLSDVTDVEHIRPKKPFPQDEREWSNLLLSCASCNRNKWDNPKDDLAHYFFPDRDNPSLYLQYRPNEVPKPLGGLATHLRARALNTLKLTGLARDDRTTPPAPKADRRWSQRVGAWAVAKEVRRLVENDHGLIDQPSFEPLFRETVKGQGFFSVWMAAFEGMPRLRSMILGFFPGTALDCFDAEGNAIERP